MSAPAGLAVEGLHTDQAPPLAIPVSFFLLAPLAMLASGAVLVLDGDAALVSRWLPPAMAATHLGTLGFLAAVMLGALYQMIPVVAGAPVPRVRLAHAVHALFVAGVGALAVGLMTGRAPLLVVAPALLLAALLLFLGPVALALARAPTRNETVWGMRLAVLGLLAVGALGVLMALARAGLVRVGGDWTAWVSAHAALGGVVWLGGLIAAVSWQVVPMFYLTAPLPRWSRVATLAALALALVVVPIVPLAGGGPAHVALAAAPALVMVWWVHPLLALRAIRQRRRKRADGSVRFWWAGLALAPLVPALAAGAALGDDPRWGVALGWCVVWGWAGMIAHGMLTRIVPFLVWFHRWAALVGAVPVPSIRGLWPDARVRLALGLHVAAVAAGAAGIVGVWAPLVQLAGALLALTGVVLGVGLVTTLRSRPAARATPKESP